MIDLARFVHCELMDDGPRYVVGAGDKRVGQRGKAVAIIGLKHTGGYEVVLHLDSGKQDSFSPMQLLPDLSDRAQDGGGDDGR